MWYHFLKADSLQFYLSMPNSMQLKRDALLIIVTSSCTDRNSEILFLLQHLFWLTSVMMPTFLAGLNPFVFTRLDSFYVENTTVSPLCIITSSPRRYHTYSTCPVHFASKTITLKRILSNASVCSKNVVCYVSFRDITAS